MQELYLQYKGLVFTLAYQLTGSVSDAEDVVQDVFLKIHGVEPERLTNPKAYLCRMATNRCRDLLKSARRKREQYFGEWLPEPIFTSREESLHAVIRGELLSYAMLVLLERLTPAERAVFVLREALNFEYAEIAEVVGKSEANCRKLLSRAREKMKIVGNEPTRPEAADEAWIRRMLSALEQDDAEAVVSLLAENVVLVSDGGGKAVAAVHPIKTKDSVAKFLLGLFRQVPHYKGGVRIEIREINGQPAVAVRSGGEIETVLLIHAGRNAIRNLFFVRNPDKLRHLNTGQTEDKR